MTQKHHIKCCVQDFSTALAALKRKGRSSTWKSNQKVLVSLKELFGDNNQLISWFGDTFAAVKDKTWLCSNANIEFNAETTRGENRKLVITKTSKINKKSTVRYLVARAAERTVKAAERTPVRDIAPSALPPSSTASDTTITTSTTTTTTGDTTVTVTTTITTTTTTTSIASEHKSSTD